ncbi:MAG: hypothetical protein HZB77_16425, partial [Chloroflexi bacterium]|nr:hypothetical protein [Chloroflexota bacterium]
LIKDRLLKLGMWGQIGVSLGAAILVILLGVAAQAAIASSPDPASWALFAKDARSLMPEGRLRIERFDSSSASAESWCCASG